MKAIILLTLAAIVRGNVCPPEDVMAPCECKDYDFGKFISCQGINEEFDLKGILDRASEYIDNSILFERLGIFSVGLQEIGEGTVEKLKFRRIEIQSNWNLNYIHPQAFRGTQNATEYVHMEGSHGSYNKINSSIFPVLNGFKKLNHVRLQSFDIETIPTNALHDLPELETVYLGSNGIFNIATNAFSNLPHLKTLRLGSNRLHTGGIAADAFKNIGESALVNLEFNDEITSLDQAGFQNLLEEAAQVKIGGCYPTLPPWFCEDKKYTCDGRADWLCPEMEKYQFKLDGYLCNLIKFEDVWAYCRWRNGQNVVH